MERLLCLSQGRQAGNLQKPLFLKESGQIKAEVTQQINSHTQNTRLWYIYQKLQQTEILKHWDLPQFLQNQYLFVDWSKYSSRDYYSMCPSSITFYMKYIELFAQLSCTSNCSRHKNCRSTNVQPSCSVIFAVTEFYCKIKCLEIPSW